MGSLDKALVVLTGPANGGGSAGGAALAQLESVANRPLLAHVLDQIAAAGVTDVGIVVAPHAAEQVRAVVEDGRAWGLRARYIRNDAGGGAGDAILAAQPFLDGDRFLLHHGDCVLDGDLAPLLRRAGRLAIDALVAVQGRRPEDDGAPGLQLTGDAARPLRLLTDANRVLAMVLGPRMLGTLRGIGPSWRGQVELVDAIDRVIAAGGNVEVRTVRGSHVGDTIEDLLACNRLLLDRLISGAAAVDRGEAYVDGRVVIDRSAYIEGSVLRGPSIIGPGAHVLDSYVGPYSAIGAGVILEAMEVEDVILGDRAVVAQLDRRLAGSVIGREARVSRDYGLSGGLRVSLGARAEIVWS